MASLGDLDLDGCDDLAVGAPYSGPNKEGKVSGERDFTMSHVEKLTCYITVQGLKESNYVSPSFVGLHI